MKEAEAMLDQVINGLHDASMTIQDMCDLLTDVCVGFANKARKDKTMTHEERTSEAAYWEMVADRFIDIRNRPTEVMK